MQAMDRHDEEQMRNRQHSSTANAVAAPKEESMAPTVSEASQSKEDTKEVKSKYGSPRRSKESPETNRTKDRALSSSRHDDIGSRSKNRRKARMQFSSDEDNDKGSLDTPAQKRRYKRSKRSSSFSESSGEESPLKQRYGKSREPKNHSMSDKRYRSDRKSPPKYKNTDDEESSIDSWKEKALAREQSASKKKKSFARRNSSSSVSSIDSPSTPRDRRRRSRDEIGRSRKDHTAYEDDTTNRERASSPSEPISMPAQETAPLCVENNLESDSDASWDLMAIKRKTDMALNQGTKHQAKQSEPSRKSHLESRKTRKRSNFSDDDQDQIDQDEDSVIHRKREARKRSAAEDEYSDYSDERNPKPKRRREPSQSRRKRLSRRAESTSDERSVLSSDDDNYEKSSSTRHQKDTKPASPSTPNTDQLFTAPAVAMTKPANASVIDDDDDGFMSDCDPLPSPSTKKAAKGNGVSRHGRKGPIAKRKSKETGKGQHFEPEPVFDDGGIRYEDRGGSPSDLHPHFENPKFGPYEPMEPLALGPSVQVPASLNRYLAPFQKEGIRFMYDCLARKSGVILGDEMVRLFFDSILLFFSKNISLTNSFRRDVAKLYKLSHCYVHCFKRQEPGRTSWISSKGIR